MLKLYSLTVTRSVTDSSGGDKLLLKTKNLLKSKNVLFTDLVFTNSWFKILKCNSGMKAFFIESALNS